MGGVLGGERNNMEWISVDDRLPEERPFRFEYVLVAKKNGVVLEAMFNTRIGEFLNISYSKLAHKVTHWMPLPKPPQLLKEAKHE